MRSSSTHILTSHAGSLPRPEWLIEANRARAAGEASDEQAFQAQLRAAVIDVVRQQKDLGIDILGDGEFGKAMGHKINYGAWWSYSFRRLGGLELTGSSLWEMPPGRRQPGEVVLTSFGDRRDREKFRAAYTDPESGVSTGPRPTRFPICTGPLTYTGHAAIAADIAHEVIG
jgi:5-methyltetrahydropteroyltriglutamate--homocysteine methyltransferase